MSDKIKNENIENKEKETKKETKKEGKKESKKGTEKQGIFFPKDL